LLKYYQFNYTINATFCYQGKKWSQFRVVVLSGQIIIIIIFIIVLVIVAVVVVVAFTITGIAILESVLRS